MRFVTSVANSDQAETCVPIDKPLDEGSVEIPASESADVIAKFIQETEGAKGD